MLTVWLAPLSDLASMALSHDK